MKRILNNFLFFFLKHLASTTCSHDQNDSYLLSYNFNDMQALIHDLQTSRSMKRIMKKLFILFFLVVFELKMEDLATVYNIVLNVEITLSVYLVLYGDHHT